MKTFTIKKRGSPEILIDSPITLLSELSEIGFISISDDLLEYLDKKIDKVITRTLFNRLIQMYKPAVSNLMIIYWTRRGYTEEEARDRISKAQKELSSKNTVFTFSKKEDNPNCKEFYLKRGYSDPVEISSLMEERKRKNSSRCVEFWIEKGLTKEEAEKEISRIQDKSACENYQRAMKENNRTWTQKQYWIDKGYSDEEAEEKLSDSQSTFSLEKCVESLGVEEGTKRWKERQDKWQDTLTSKSQGDLDLINKSKFSGGGYSQVSQELFNNLNREESRYASKNKEYRIKLKSGKHVSVDYFYNNKIIEFNGDLWHANPNKFQPEDKPLESKFFGNQITAKEIWDKDAKRIEEIKELGYDVLVVWESDYRNKKKETINKCINFLQKGTQTHEND